MSTGATSSSGQEVRRRRPESSLWVAWDARCSTPGPNGQAYYWEGPRAEENRWKAALTIYDLGIHRPQSSLAGRTITAKGRFEMVRYQYRLSPLTAADAAQTITHWLRWTLQQLYAVDQRFGDIDHIPVKGLRLRMAEALPPAVSSPPPAPYPKEGSP